MVDQIKNFCHFQAVDNPLQEKDKEENKNPITSILI